MPRDYSAKYKETVSSTGAREAPLLLLEITHPQLGSPVRVVNDNQDLLSNGLLFVAMAFRVTPPDDLEQGLPRASLAVDNIGRELTQWIEGSAGGADAQVRMMQVLRSDPDTIEWEVTLTMKNLEMDMLEVRGELGFEDILNRPAVPLIYRPDVAPGLF